MLLARLVNHPTHEASKVGWLVVWEQAEPPGRPGWARGREDWAGQSDRVSLGADNVIVIPRGPTQTLPTQTNHAPKEGRREGWQPTD